MVARASLGLTLSTLVLLLPSLAGCGTSADIADPTVSGMDSPSTSVSGTPVEETMVSDRVAEDASAIAPKPVGSFSLAQPLPESAEPNSKPQRRLSLELTPKQLVQFLAGADEDMRNVISQSAADVENPTESSHRAMVDELKRIVLLKREASQRLIAHKQATALEVATGQRGLMQSLSHLASLGDLSAADELQAFAIRLSSDPDPGVRADSQLVLIGFALEQLRFGKSGSADKVVEVIESFFASEAQADVAALMVMGQAKDTLVEYGYLSQAETVRQLISERYSDATNLSVAEMASQIVGQPILKGPLAEIETLRKLLLDPSTRSTSVSDSDLSRWRAAVSELGNQNVDMTAVRTLALLGLESEAAGRTQLAQAVDAVLETLTRNHNEVGREARTALEASKNRRKVIGARLNPDLPSISGAPLSMASFRGKVVLMPFWSAEFPESLSVIGTCRDVVSQFPEKVAIVGMNLDRSGMDVSAFMEREGLDFPSYRSVSDPDQPIVNEVAYRFGAVTLIFIVVIDGEGRVKAVNFSGRDLAEQVAALVD